MIYPSQGGSNNPGPFTHNKKNDDIYKYTKVLSREYDYDWQKKENYKDKCETQEHAIDMWIARLCYADYVIGSSKKNFEQEVLKPVLNGFDFGDINHSSELYSKFMLFISEQVTKWRKSFFSPRLDHTGCKSPVSVQADKGRNVHRTKQFTSVVAIVPECPSW